MSNLNHSFGKTKTIYICHPVVRINGELIEAFEFFAIFRWSDDCSEDKAGDGDKRKYCARIGDYVGSLAQRFACNVKTRQKACLKLQHITKYGFIYVMMSGFVLFIITRRLLIDAPCPIRSLWPKFR